MTKREPSINRSKATGKRSSPARVTVNDVARKAGVSPMTVSNFMNGRFESMSEATRTEVAAAVRELGYRRDSTARSLRTAHHMSVGMIVVDESPLYLTDGATTQVVSGLSNALNERGYTLQLEGLRAGDLETSSLLRDVRTDGLCVLLSGKPAARRAMLERIAEAGQPIVLCHEQMRAGDADLCCVLQDDRAGAAGLAELVLAKGAKKILLATFGLNRWKAVGERERAIEAAAATASCHLEMVGCGSGNMADATAAIAGALEKRGVPDAIMAMNDQIAIAALQVLRAKKLAVPDQVMVTGFNAFEFWQYAEPTLTTVRTPCYDVGQAAGDAMVTRITEGRFARKVIKLPVTLVPGKTTR